MENFQGKDGFVWFTGVVEDRDDPSKLGRVRVRCVGYHTDNKTKIPTEDLPWAWVMQNIHTPSMDGEIRLGSWLKELGLLVSFVMQIHYKNQLLLEHCQEHSKSSRKSKLWFS